MDLTTLSLGCFWQIRTALRTVDTLELVVNYFGIALRASMPNGRRMLGCLSTIHFKGPDVST